MAGFKSSKRKKKVPEFTSFMFTWPCMIAALSPRISKCVCTLHLGVIRSFLRDRFSVLKLRTECCFSGENKQTNKMGRGKITREKTMYISKGAQAKGIGSEIRTSWGFFEIPSLNCFILLVWGRNYFITVGLSTNVNNRSSFLTNLKFLEAD